jgi:hypothetical protein
MDEKHDAPSSMLWVIPVGCGAILIAQLVPFHASLKGSVAAVLTFAPTAVQDVVEAHDTLTRELPVVPLGLGVDWRAQLVPSHTSAKVTLPEVVVSYPVASQNAAEAHDTPSSTLTVALLGSGVGWTDQLVPFHDSVSRLFVPPCEPTAMQELADVHDIPFR